TARIEQGKRCPSRSNSVSIFSAQCPIWEMKSSYRARANVAKCTFDARCLKDRALGECWLVSFERVTASFCRETRELQTQSPPRLRGDAMTEGHGRGGACRASSNHPALVSAT